jgi:mono/diheme cytochrome c family protein
MGLSRLDWVLAAGVVGALAGSLFVHPDLTIPNWEFMPDMARGASYTAYERNPHFADGKTLQRQQPGTIARGQHPLHYAATPEDAERAGRELHSPYAGADSDVMNVVRERGVRVFAAFCVACHGGGGAGDGAVAQRGFPPPPSLLAPHAREISDGRMFHAVTYGQGNMPGHAPLVAPEDRWKVIAYIRRMQEEADGE